MLIRMCHEKKKKGKISVTINNKRQTLCDDHPTSFFYHHHHPKKPSYHLRISEAFNYLTGGRNTGLGITWCGGGGGGRHSAHAHWQQTWRLQTISTYFHPGSHGARCAERVRAHFPHIHSLTHKHTTVRLSNVSSHVHGKNALLLLPPLPPSLPPVYPPSILFLSKFKFCFTAKKTTPTKHTAFVQKTLTGFLATRHQGCVLLKWYFDRQCNTYFTEQIFI